MPLIWMTHHFASLLCLQEILNYINRKEFDPLLKVDQLNLEREKNKVFFRFGESACCYDNPVYFASRCSRWWKR